MADHLFVFANNKAGMDGVDRSKVNETIYELSKDSAFFKNSLEKDAKTDARIAELRRRLESKRRHDLHETVDALVANLEAKRCLSRVHVVVDMDMFFAAVEMRDRPELAQVPMAVGGMGMISTANYEARKFGVRAAMPGFIGKKLCPDLVFVPPDMAKYAAVAEVTRRIFAEYDPQFAAASMDEAYLDITDVCLARGAVDTASMEAAAAAVTAEMRQRILETTKLTASAGIATNAKLAKVCSDINKPNGQYLLPFTRDALVKFIENLPIRKLGGIGKVREKVLAALGIHTGLDLFNARYDVFHIHSETTARWLLEISMGVYEGAGGDERKSVSRESTFAATASLPALKSICKDIVQHVKADLLSERVTGLCVTLKLKTEAFHVRTRAFTSKMSVEPTLLDLACMLLEREVRHDQKTIKPPPRYRLMGLRISKLQERDASCDVAATSQLRLEETLFGPPPEATCPVCASIVPRAQLQRHIQGCLGDDDPRSFAVDVPMSSSSSSSSPPTKRKKRSFFPDPPILTSSRCPVCNEPTASNVLATHVEACVARSTSPSSSKPLAPGETLTACPICGQSFESQSPAWMNRHIEACLTTEKTNATTAADGRSPSCPVCSAPLDTASTQAVNDHLDVCLGHVAPRKRHKSIKSFFQRP